MTRVAPLLFACFLACNGSKLDPDAQVDLDGDGSPPGEDCNDADPDVHPGAIERCNGMDDDCDGAVDEFLPGLVWYADSDGDGFGRASAEIEACARPEGFSDRPGDCNDADPAFYPGAPEPCTEEIDYNCDGSVGFADSDGDGTPACMDCNDIDADVHPGAIEFCNGQDDDCNGVPDDDPVDLREWYVDMDEDGYGDDALPTTWHCDRLPQTAPVGGDCNDGDADFHPGADEDCADPVDFNCDGSILFEDADADGSPACLDCNDADETAYPGAPEFCDEVDDDCDRVIDEDAVDALAWYADLDGDQFGNAAVRVDACVQPDGHVADSTDCNDGDPTVFPGSVELCDDEDRDEDCDGLADDADPNVAEHTKVPWYADVDSDGHGADGPNTVLRCDVTEGYSALADDCDDTRDDVNPSAVERCDPDLVDEDCNGLANDDDVPVDQSTWYRDADNDGHGNPTRTTLACVAPVGYVAADDDCNDADGSAYPGADERCDGVDDDCDGTIDEDPVDPPTFYADLDGDGYGTPAATVVGCVPPAGFVALSTDCDDTRSEVNPGARELCDAANVDEDCDGLADDADSSAIGKTRYYRDDDGDGFGANVNPSDFCDPPQSGFVDIANDCDDADPAQHPGATEIVGNGEDDDCNGSEICLSDDDGDGFVSDTPTTRISTDGDCDDPFEALAGAPAGDCDDNLDLVYPGAVEICGDGVDNDCVAPVDDCVFGGEVRSTSATVVLGGLNKGDQLGRSLAVGDFDGDGQDDLLASMPYSDVPASSAGAAVLWYGPVTTSGLTSTADLQLNGSVSSQYTGWDVAAVDMNGDGRDEIVVGAYGPTSTPGSVHVIHGTATPMSGVYTLATYAATSGATYVGAANGDYLGRAIGTGGDLDGDGYEDLVMGAYGNDTAATTAGAAYVVYGSATPVSGTQGVNAAAAATFLGSASSDNLGYTVTVVSDVNGDGLDELLLGAYLYEATLSSQGAAFLFLGESGRFSGTMTAALAADVTVLGTATTDYAGRALASLGDQDGDGYGDYGVSADGYDTPATSAGALFVMAGGVSPSAVPVAMITGAASSNYLGEEPASPGDLDGDGHDEVLVGAYGADGLRTNAGAAYLFYGPVAGTVSAAAADATFLGSEIGGGDSYFGQRLVDGPSDVDGDGFLDVVGAGYYDDLTSSDGLWDAGGIYIFSPSGL